jgi:N-acetylmuramoyl-L-alanine amidase
MMNYRILLLLALILVTTHLNIAQDQLAIVAGGTTKYVPVYYRQGTIYFPIKHFADAISANYYYNENNGKIELKFDRYNLKITAKNPYFVLTSRENKETKSLQLPTSSYLINNQIVIPLVYSIKILQSASGLDLKYEKPGKLIIKGNIGTEEVTSLNYNITGLSMDEKANGTLVRVKSKKRITAYNSSFKDGVLTVIFRNVNADVNKLNKFSGEGLVREINAKNIGKDIEIKFALSKEYTTSEVLNAEGSNDILISLHNKIFTRSEERERNRAKWDFDVIVIDAGHGGKDVGAIGVNSVKEKDINLGVALKLGKLLEKEMKDVKVVYTRKDDTFIELFKRGKIANDNGGKLFISIHCNSTPDKPSNASGFEVYLLRPGRTKEAIEIAERENSVIRYEENQERYQKLTDENFILVSMAHSAYMKYSEKFSDLLDRQFSSDLSLNSRGIKQAGFYVLVGASMPSVLIETGFLSNKQDAAYLKSTKGQTEIANSIYLAINSFKEHYEKEMQTEL